MTEKISNERHTPEVLDQCSPIVRQLKRMHGSPSLRPPTTH